MKLKHLLFSIVLVSLTILIPHYAAAQQNVSAEERINIGAYLSAIESAVNEGNSTLIIQLLAPSAPETLAKAIEDRIAGRTASFEFHASDFEQTPNGTILVSGHYSYKTPNRDFNGLPLYFEFQVSGDGWQLVDTDLPNVGSFGNMLSALDGEFGVVFFVVLLLLCLGVGILMIVSLWIIFKKAGYPGWASIVPIYNMYILLHISGRSGWWMIPLFIPFINFILIIFVIHGIAQNFGKGIEYTIGLFLLPFIFFPLLAFGNSTYRHV